MQVALLAMLGMTRYFCDCESVVTALTSGRAHVVRADKMHANAYGLLFAAVDDVVGDDFTWMPAHKGESQVGVATKGDGSSLTLQDLEAIRRRIV